MTTVAEWIEGARPRTLPAAIAPVLVGSGVAAYVDAFDLGRAALALVVSLAVQVGVNYANDYSDGVRGADATRVGPRRLVASGLASGLAVRNAALVALGVAAVAGLILALATAWWLVLVGAVAFVAAWTYTGGARPYGYRGLGELSVFVFFGLVAVGGTAYVQIEEVTWAAFVGGVAIGALACALLVANNLRDLPTDAAVGKQTLAVRIGDRWTRRLYVGLVGLGLALTVLLAAITSWWVLIGILAGAAAITPVRVVSRGATGMALVPVLRATGLLELAYAVLLTLGLAIAS